MKKIYSFIILALLLAIHMSAQASDDLEKPIRQQFFKASPKNREDAEKLILPILKNTSEVSSAARDFFDLAFNPENTKLTAFLTAAIWNNLIDHLFEKGNEDQLIALNGYYMRCTQVINRKKRAEI